MSFYTGVSDRLSFACRLLRKAQLSGARVAVHGPAAMLDRLDAALWTFEATEFVPHLRLRPGVAVPEVSMRLSPLLLVDDLASVPHREMLLHLGLEIPEAALGFARVLEVVGTDEEHVHLGRQRFRQYRAQGCEVKHHEVSS